MALVTDIQSFRIGGDFKANEVTGRTGSLSGSLLGVDGVQNTEQTSIANVSFVWNYLRFHP